MNIRAMQVDRMKARLALTVNIARLGITEEQAMVLAARVARLAHIDDELAMAELRKENRAY